MRACVKCDSPLPTRSPGPGRPRTVCDICKTISCRKCKKCGDEYRGPKGRLYCSDHCRALARQARKELRRRINRSGDPVVYFIQAEDRIGPIKIGVASWPEDRLRRLQTACPHRLVILKTLPGGYGAEQAFHAIFEDARMTGEWFRPVPELLALLQ